ncbi:Protein of unknown function [Gryllus bimaculatus]|nr:Protein of unknown function [Gryllus bimaculatus]
MGGARGSGGPRSAVLLRTEHLRLNYPISLSERVNDVYYKKYPIEGLQWESIKNKDQEFKN